MKKVTQILIFAFIGVVTVNTAKAQTYDPYDVQVINNLIANNGLQATPDAPETWDFATWNDETPKQIIELFLPSFYSGWEYYLSGDVSLAGLTTLKKLDCFYCPKKSQMSNPKELATMQNRSITKLNVANCISLHTLDCRMNFDLTELDLTNCTNLQILACNYNNLSTLDVTHFTQLKELDCGSSKLNKLDVTNCTQLETLDCSYTRLTELDVSKCKFLKSLWCYANYLSVLDLTGLDNLTNYSGEFQNISLTLVKNEAEEYTRTITLNNPTFGNSAISYSDGILKSTDNTVTSTSFTVQTNKEGFELSGTMHFNYSTVGINTPDMEQLKIYPNPTTGELRVTSNELHVTNIEIFDIMGKNVSCLISHIAHPISIDISHFPSGIYFVKIITDTGVVVKKVVKQ